MGTRRSPRLPAMYFLRDEGKGEGSAVKVVAVLSIASSWFGLRNICNCDLFRNEWSVLRDKRLLHHKRWRGLAAQNRVYVVQGKQAHR